MKVIDIIDILNDLKYPELLCDNLLIYINMIIISFGLLFLSVRIYHGKKILRGLISVISFSLSLIIMWLSIIDVFVCSSTTDTENMFVYDDLSHHWITTDECLIITPEMRDDAVTVEYSYFAFTGLLGMVIKINAVFHYTPEKYDHYLQTLTERYHERVETAEDINQKELTVIILRELEDYEGAYMAFCDDNNTVYFCCYDM